MSAIDNLERQLESKLLRQLYGNDPADCCEVCSRLIDSKRQIDNPGTTLCALCAERKE